MKIEVKRITDPNLFRECAEMTTGEECKMSWNKALCSGHSIIRASEYLIKMYDIPQCVCGHLVRHVHAEPYVPPVQPYVLSKRPDRGGTDFRTECIGIANTLDASYAINDDGAHEEMVGMVRELPKHFDRHALTNMALKLNAEEIINISKVRLCGKASEETREVWSAVVREIDTIDRDLANHCRPTCVFRGGICPEIKSCGFNKTELFSKQLHNYKQNFVK